MINIIISFHIWKANIVNCQKSSTPFSLIKLNHLVLHNPYARNSYKHHRQTYGDSS